MRIVRWFPAAAADSMGMTQHELAEVPELRQMLVDPSLDEVARLECALEQLAFDSLTGIVELYIGTEHLANFERSVPATDGTPIVLWVVSLACRLDTPRIPVAPAQCGDRQRSC